MVIYILCSKAEVFIATRSKTLQPYTELRITAGQQTISDQLCCMSDHFSPDMAFHCPHICNSLL